MNDIYALLAPYYDLWNREIDYSSWADGMESFFASHAKDGKVGSILDLACGTGRMTVELARRGYDMIGADGSAEMLTVARNAAEKAGKQVSSAILWLLQDMRSFELYGTVDAVISCLDSVNHLTVPGELATCFSLVHNYLNPDGLFLFDVNSKVKFEKVYADESYSYEAPGVYCSWVNRYKKSRKECDFRITLFKETGNGLYRRYDGLETERYYSVRELKAVAEKTGFAWIGAYATPDGAPLSGDEHRLYIALRAKKPECGI